MALSPRALRLYLVTDPDLAANGDVTATVAAALRGGVSFVQLRDKTAGTAARIAAARALRPLLAGSGVPLVINDDLEAALAAGADGVHLGQEDGSVAEARARLGPGRIIGLSCETEAQVRAAPAGLVNYLGLGTVFATATKADHKPQIGLDGLARMARLARAAGLPSVAIGGLKPAHAARVMAAGCDGMAVVSAICGQPDPQAAARALRMALDAGLDTGPDAGPDVGPEVGPEVGADRTDGAPDGRGGLGRGDLGRGGFGIGDGRGDGSADGTGDGPRAAPRDGSLDGPRDGSPDGSRDGVTTGPGHGSRAEAPEDRPAHGSTALPGTRPQDGEAG